MGNDISHSFGLVSFCSWEQVLGFAYKLVVLEENRRDEDIKNSVKNNADVFIFHTAICFWAKTNSYDGR